MLRILAGALAEALVDALCLCMALRLTGRRVRFIRLAAAALLGAALARAVGRPWDQAALRAMSWLPAGWLMMGVAGGGWRIRGLLAFLSSCGLVGGTVYALCGALGSLRAGWAVGAAAAGMMAVSLLRAQRAQMAVHRARILLGVNGETAVFDAMMDSGNTLRDYLTHRPVVVLPQSALCRLGVAPERLRPIFADTAGGRRMMGCLTPQKAILLTDGRKLPVRVCAAFSPALPMHAPALVPQSLLDDMDASMGDRQGSLSDQEGDGYGKTMG